MPSTLTGLDMWNRHIEQQQQQRFEREPQQRLDANRREQEELRLLVKLNNAIVDLYLIERAERAGKFEELDEKWAAHKP